MIRLTILALVGSLLAAQSTGLAPDQIKRATVPASLSSITLLAVTPEGVLQIALGPSLRLMTATGGGLVLDVVASATTNQPKLTLVTDITRNADGSYNLPGGIPAGWMPVYRNGQLMKEGGDKDYVRGPYLITPVKPWLVTDRVEALKVE